MTFDKSMHGVGKIGYTAAQGANDHGSENFGVFVEIVVCVFEIYATGGFENFEDALFFLVVELIELFRSLAGLFYVFLVVLT